LGKTLREIVDTKAANGTCFFKSISRLGVDSSETPKPNARTKNKKTDSSETPEPKPKPKPKKPEKTKKTKFFRECFL